MGSARAKGQGVKLGSRLTSNEMMVLDLLIEGLTSKEIGNELGKTEANVNNLIESAGFRLGARNRIHLAVIYARDLGLTAEGEGGEPTNGRKH